MGRRAASDRGPVPSSSVVADSSPLIALERVGRVHLLVRVFSTVVIPPALAGEMGPSIADLAWIDQRRLRYPIDLLVARASLGDGDKEAIGLAAELGATRVILDDAPARALARQLDLPLVGTLGLLAVAKRRAVIPAVRPMLDELLATGFRITPDLYQELLSEVDEALCVEHRRIDACSR